MPYDVAEFKIDPLQLTTPRARMEYLRDFLRALPAERFYIGNYVSVPTPDGRRGGDSTEALRDCGTAACIAGWAAYLFDGSPISCALPNTGETEAHEAAAELLGLNEDEAYALFIPIVLAGRWNDITNADAALVLDHLIRTGRVDWSVAPSS